MYDEVHKIDSKYLPEGTNNSNIINGTLPGSLRAITSASENPEYLIGGGAVTFGEDTQAAGSFAFATGHATKAIGDYSHAEGYDTTASGFGSHAAGSNSIASGDYSHAEGDHTRASDSYSHTEGGGTEASARYSHAEGHETNASGAASHAEGHSTNASGHYSHAEGSGTTAIGGQSHAEGNGTKASGEHSHAEGYYTDASGENQHVHGKYNIVDYESRYVHIVGNGNNGNGDGQNLSNAHTLDWEGNAWFSGDVYVGSTSGINKDEGSKKLATEEYVESAITITAESITNALGYTPADQADMDVYKQEVIITPGTVEEQVVNVFADTAHTWAEGLYINYATGEASAHANYYGCEDYFEIPAGGKVFGRFENAILYYPPIAFYTESKTYISGEAPVLSNVNERDEYNGMYGYFYAIPENAKYFRFSVNTDIKSIIQMYLIYDDVVGGKVEIPNLVGGGATVTQDSIKNALGYVPLKSNGWSAGKNLGTDENGNVIEKEDIFSKDASAWSPVEYMTGVEWTALGYYRQPDGALVSTQYTTEYQSTKELIRIEPGCAYTLTNFRGAYILYDANGKNGVLTDAGSNPNEQKNFETNENQYYIGINHKAITDFPPGRVSLIRTNISQAEYDALPTRADSLKSLYGKKVVCLGDSLFGMHRGADSAPAFVAAETGATVYNVGFGGCRMSVHHSTGYAAFSMWALAKAIAENDWTTQDAQASSGSDYFPDQLALLKSIDFNEVDIVVIHYGTNDFGAGNAISLDNTSDPDDYTTLRGALRYSIDKLLGAYPHLRIYISLPVYRYWTADDGTVTYAETYVGKSGKTLPEFVEALRNTAMEYNLPVIDGYYGLGINKVNAATFLSDGTHHNAVGRERFGRYIGTHLIAQQSSGKSGIDMATVQQMIEAALAALPDASEVSY